MGWPGSNEAEYKANAGTKPLQVQFLSHLFPNDEERVKGVFVRELAHALLPYAKMAVSAPISYFPVLRERRGVRLQERWEGLEVHHPRYLALPQWLFRYRWRAYAIAIRKLLLLPAERPDIVHVHWTYPDGMAAVRLAERSRVKVVITVHGHAAMGYFDPPERQSCFAEPLRSAARIIAVSEELKGEIVKRHSIAAEKIAVVHNGYSPDKFSPGSKQAARVALRLPADAKLIVTIARLSEEKGLDLLIEAVNQCTPGTVLYILGDGPLYAALREQVQGLNLSERVHLPGAIEHEKLGDWLRAADLFCLPSHNEGCPVVVHEALACGTPVIASRVGAIPDLVTSETYGLLSKPGDVPQLARNLNAGLEKNWDHGAIARHGAEFTWDAVARKTMKVYHEALA